MTRSVTNPSFPRRVANVTIIALCVASSLALLGAVPVEWAQAGKWTNGGAASEAPSVAVANVEDDPAQPAKLVTGPHVDVDFESLQPDMAVREAASPATVIPLTRVVRMEVTAYCPCSRCCGSNARGITASGKTVDYNGGKFVAADTKALPFGRELVIPGYADNAAVEVIDRGGAIKGDKLDVYFATHEEALVWGRQHLDVIVYD